MSAAIYKPKTTRARMPGILTTKENIRWLTIIAIGLSILASVLHISGFVTPGWTVIKVVAVDSDGGALFDISYHSSLWYITVCSETKCNTKGIWSLSNDNSRLNWIYYTISDGIVAYQTEASVAVILTIIAGVIVLVSFRSNRSDFTTLCLIITAMACHIIAGVAALVASGSKAQDTVKWKDVYDLKFPFSVLLIGLAALVNIASAAILVPPLIYVVRIMKRPSSIRQSLMTSSLQPPMTSTVTEVPESRQIKPEIVEKPVSTKKSKSSKYKSGTLKDWQHTDQNRDLEWTQNGVRNERQPRRNRKNRDEEDEYKSATSDYEKSYTELPYDPYKQSKVEESSYDDSGFRVDLPSYNQLQKKPTPRPRKSLTRKSPDKNVKKSSEYNDVTRSEEYRSVTRSPEQSDVRRAPEYNDVTRSPKYNDVTRSQEYSDILRSPEYNDVTRSHEYRDVTRSSKYNDVMNSPGYSDVIQSPKYNDVTNNRDFLSQARKETVASVRPSGYWEQMETHNHAYDNKAADPIESVV